MKALKRILHEGAFVIFLNLINKKIDLYSLRESFFFDGLAVKLFSWLPRKDIVSSCPTDAHNMSLKQRSLIYGSSTCETARNNYLFDYLLRRCKLT